MSFLFFSFFFLFSENYLRRELATLLIDTYGSTTRLLPHRRLVKANCPLEPAARSFVYTVSIIFQIRRLHQLMMWEIRC